MISLSNNLLVFNKTGETLSVYVSSNSEWSITNKYDSSFWTITPTQGKSGVTEVVITSSKSKDQKKAILTLQDNDDTKKIYLAVDAPSAAKSEVITVTPSTYTFPASGGTLNVEVVCPDYNWSTDAGRYWVTLSPSYNTGSTTNITVTAAENSGDSRSTGFLFTVDDPDETFGYLTLAQEAVASPSFGVSPSSLDFAAVGGSIPVTVSGVSQDWNAYTVGDGITISPSSGTGDTTVIVNMTANTGSTVRNGYINFTHGSDFKTVFTTQPGGAPTAYFAISPGGGTFEQTGDTKTVNVISNYSWTASTNANYVTLSPSTGTGNGTVSISVPANTGSSRNFTVVFTDEFGTALSYGGTQGQAIKITPSTARYAYTGESKTISVECDYTWTATSDSNWFSFAPSTGNGDATVTVQVPNYETTSVRTGNITFTDDKGNSATYQVVQEAYVPQTITITGQTEVVWSSQTQYWRASSNRSGTFTVTSSQNWCEITGLTQGDTGCTFYLSYGRNTGDQPRTTIITVSQGTGSTTATFTQGSASNYISVSPENSYIGSSSTAVILAVTRSSDLSASDMGFTTTGDLAYDSIVWDGNKTQLTVSIPTNHDNQSKSLYITITGGTASAEAVITQSPGTNTQITVSGNTTAAYNDTSASFSAASNEQGTFTITSSNPSWCQVTGITQDGYNCRFRLTFGTNQGVSNRTSVITITQGDTVKSFTFTQEAYAGDHYLRFTPSSVYVTSGASQAYSTTLSQNGIVANTITMVDGFSGNMPVTSCTWNGSRIHIEFGASTSFQEQSYTRTIRGLGTDGNYYSASYTFIQRPMNYNPGPSVGGETNPIWKETVLNGVEGANGYKLLVDNQVVYAGKIYTIPGRDIDFRINDIARDFLEHSMSFTEGMSSEPGYVKTFMVAIDGGNSYNYTFYNDWSYVENAGPNLGDPISPEVPAGALVPFNVFNGSATIYANGSSIATFSSGSDTQTRYTVRAQEGVEYVCGNVKYKGVSPCKHEYVIYYINAFGGMDAFTPQNSKMRTDNITSYEMNQRYATPASDFSQKRYLADVLPTWEFNTGWLTDEQSVKMHHLIESPMVYLYDCVADTYTPVVMTENSLQYKSFFNQGRKKVAYTFTLKQSTTKQRR